MWYFYYAIQTSVFSSVVEKKREKWNENDWMRYLEELRWGLEVEVMNKSGGWWRLRRHGEWVRRLFPRQGHDTIGGMNWEPRRKKNQGVGVTVRLLSLFFKRWGWKMPMFCLIRYFRFGARLAGGARCGPRFFFYLKMYWTSTLEVLLK